MSNIEAFILSTVEYYVLYSEYQEYPPDKLITYLFNFSNDLNIFSVRRVGLHLEHTQYSVSDAWQGVDSSLQETPW